MLDPSLLEPPTPLKPAALAIWNRHAQRIAAEGRMTVIDVDALMVYCRTLATYEELQSAVEDTGVLVTGRDGALVKNPVLPALASTRDSLLRAAKAVPLTDAAAAKESAKFDKYLAALDAEDGEL
jgi:P27 family predicted phage terminase small subunit